MKTKLIAMLPFYGLGYCMGAILLAFFPPWIINQGPDGTGRLFEGYAFLFSRAHHSATNGTVDLSGLLVELVALAFLIALPFVLYACWLRFQSAELSHTPMHKDCPACDALRDQVTPWQHSVKA